MKTREVNELAEQLDEHSRKAILQLIDLKSENDMKETVAQLKIMDKHLELLSKHLVSVETNIKAEIETKIATAYWLIGIVGGVISILLTILALKK